MESSYLKLFDQISTWKRNDERAPHKPLLILWAIGRCLQGKERLVEYAVVHEALIALLDTFGPPRQHQKPQEPFWRLQRDGVWVIPNAHRIPKDASGGVSAGRLREFSAKGGFPEDLYELFHRDTSAALNVAQKLVDDHFPESMRTAVLEATLGERMVVDPWYQEEKSESDLSPLIQSLHNRRTRNPNFRKEVLPIYGYRCAVCKFSLEFPVEYRPALEAAHIKWHSYRGPDEASNGLALCVLHHELFDWGAFTILPESLEIVVANKVVHQGSANALTEFHGLKLPVRPKNRSDWPATNYLNWHARNVFRDYSSRKAYV